MIEQRASDQEPRQPTRNEIDPVDPVTGRRPSDVEYFTVCREAVVDGKRIFNYPLSPDFSTLEKAEEALDKLRAQYPDAGIGGGVKLFNPLREGSAAERAQFVRSLA